MIFFSISYEENLFDLVRMLVADGIEPLREKRAGGPLIIAGGPVISSNPVPFFPIADILCAGEGEELLPRVIDAGRPAFANTDLHRSKLATRDILAIKTLLRNNAGTTKTSGAVKECLWPITRWLILTRFRG